MADARRGLRWRAAWLVAGVVLILIWTVARPAGGRYVIQVEFGAAPELEGADVLIDGVEAGTLERRGSRTLTGFRVDEGDHVVIVGSPRCPGRPASVTTGFGAAVVRLVAYRESRITANEEVCWVELHL